MTNLINKSAIKDRVLNSIREVPDFPKPGINFKDITPILQDIELFNDVTNYFIHEISELELDAVIGIESRGFIFGMPLASQIKKSFVPVRKPGKLPAATIKETYILEYGEDSLEIHEDAFKNGSKNILIVDDLLATGGTALATYNLVKKLGAENVTLITLIELSFLGARTKLEDNGLNVKSMTSY